MGAKIHETVLMIEKTTKRVLSISMKNALKILGAFYPQASVSDLVDGVHGAGLETFKYRYQSDDRERPISPC